MNLSITERLIIANQFKILERLYPEEAEYYSDLIRRYNTDGLTVSD